MNTMFASGLLCGVASTAMAADVLIHVQQRQGAPAVDAVVSLQAESVALSKADSVAVIDQRQRMFEPYVTVVQKGSQIRFPNHDQTKHHVYSFSKAKRFDLQLYQGHPAAPVTFDRAGVVVLGCNIHDWMLAYIDVVDTPYFAKTTATGQARLSDVPEGKYTLVVWHPRLRQAFQTALQVSAKDQQKTVVIDYNLPDPRQSLAENKDAMAERY